MKANNQTPLEKALAEIMLEEFADVPREEEIPLTASPLFHKRMKKAGKTAAVTSVRGVRATLKRAVLIAAILVILATSVFAIREVGGTFIHFLVNDNGSHYTFSFDAQQAATAPRTIETVYHASFIPKGYTLTTSNVQPSGVIYYWKNEAQENYIMFQQSIIGDVDRVPYSDDANAVTLNINGYQVFRVRNDATIYCWTDNEYFFSLYFGPDVNEAHKLDIFNGIKPLGVEP